MLLHQLEAVGHAEALDAMFTAIQRNQYPTEQQITTLHRLLLRKLYLNKRAFTEIRVFLSLVHPLYHHLQAKYLP